MAQDLIVENNSHEITTDVLQTRIQDIRRDIMDHVNERIDDMMSEILKTVGTMASRKSIDIDTDKYRDKIKSSKDILPTKHFVERDSLLTDLLEMKHIRTLYNIFMVIHIIMFTNAVIHDIMATGLPKLGFATIARGFGKFSNVIYTWLLMKASTFAVFIAFRIWAQRRFEYSPKSLLKRLWDYGWLLGFIFYQILFLVLPTKAMIDEDLPLCSSLVVLMEQVRMLMKTHAFVRSAAARFLSYKSHTEETMPKAPNFSQFLYFMFAPTLVYQDNYPRTKRIRWEIVVARYSEVIMIIFFITFTFESFVFPVFAEFGQQPIGWLQFILIIVKAMLPAILFFLCGFYCLLHAWMNGSAELLQFADRMFYKDWWNSSSYSTYYRKWNVVVHDWLYTYVYKDMYEIVTRQNKILSVCAVFTISAIAHEYIMAFAFRFFCPVMLILFGFFGHVIVFMYDKSGNMFIWFSFFVGNGLMLSFYAMEYYARVNCPSYYDELLDLFIPRSWLCLVKTTD